MTVQESRPTPPDAGPSSGPAQRGPADSLVQVLPRSAHPQRRFRMLAVVLTGLYSWMLTILPAITIAGSVTWVGISGWLALLTLVAAPLLPTARLSIVFSLDVFLSMCVISWWCGRDLEGGAPFGVFGSFGWLAYILALGALSTPSNQLETSAGGADLEPRATPRYLPFLALLACVVGALVLLSAAWSVERRAVAVLAHVVALSAALFALRAGAHLSGYLQTSGTRLERPLRLRDGNFALVLCGLLLALGVWLVIS